MSRAAARKKKAWKSIPKLIRNGSGSISAAGFQSLKEISAQISSPKPDNVRCGYGSRLKSNRFLAKEEEEKKKASARLSGNDGAIGGGGGGGSRLFLYLLLTLFYFFLRLPSSGGDQRQVAEETTTGCLHVLSSPAVSCIVQYWHGVQTARFC